MEKKSSDYLHLYGCDCPVMTPDGVGSVLVIYPKAVEVSLNTIAFKQEMKGRKGGGEMHYKYFYPDVKPILRPLSDMTEGEMVDILMLQVPGDMEDKPTRDDYDLEMFYNDNSTMVDGDVIIGAEYSCSCYIGQISFLDDGRAVFTDEDGEFAREGLTPKSFHYLLSKHFDLFGLIEAGLAIDKTKISNNGK